MQTTTAPRQEDAIDRLAPLAAGASRLAMSFMEEAEAETDAKEKRATTDLFLRCFLAARIGEKLVMGLMAADARSPTPAREASDREPADRDPDRERGDDERDRDYEPVSLPRFLQTLGRAAADAEHRGAGLPADIRNEILPELRRLLADTAATAAPARAAGVAVLARPGAQPASNARARLLGSAWGPPSLAGLPLRRQDSS